MKTSSQPLIVTNYISLCLCNSHCSNLIQSALGSRNQAGAQDLHSSPCILGNPTSQSASDTVSPTPCPVLGGRASGCDAAQCQNVCRKAMPWIRVLVPHIHPPSGRSSLRLLLLRSCLRCDSEIKKKKILKLIFLHDIS